MGEPQRWRVWRPLVWTYRGWAARVPNNYQGVREHAVRVLMAAGERPAWLPGGESRRFTWQVWLPADRPRPGFVVEPSDAGVTVVLVPAVAGQVEPEAAARYAEILAAAGYLVAVEHVDGDDVVNARPGPLLASAPRPRWRTRPVP